MYFVTLLLLNCFVINYHVESCRHLRIESLSEDIDFLNGDYSMEPTLIADGRAVYVEHIDPSQHQNEEGQENTPPEPRVIYHYSHGNLDEMNEEERNNFQYYGRWIIGNNIFSSNGWAFLSGWSIEPVTDTINSLITSDFSHINELALYDSITPEIRNSNKGINGMYRKMNDWKIWLNEEWITRNDLMIHCIDEHLNEQENNEWLFITTNDHFGINNNNNNNNTIAQTSYLNYQTIHGFYYRLNHYIWKLIDHNIYLYCNIDDNATSISTSINEHDNSTIQHTHKLDKECILYEYHGYTDENGIPIDGIHHLKLILNTSLELNNLINQYPWEKKNVQNNFIYYSNKKVENKELSQKVNIIIINSNYATPGSELEIIKTRKLTIYDSYREYYYRLKSHAINYKHQYFDILYKTLNNGLPFHMLGLGTGGLAPNENDTLNILNDALHIGYRLIDSSSAYWSELPLGNIIINNKFNRNDLFIVTKVWPTDLGFLETYDEILKSLNRLNSNYIDHYMIHWPACYEQFTWMDCNDASHKHWSQSYMMMEKLYSEGRLLSIGVSNFDFNLMSELESNAQLSILPQVLQNYFDIAHQDWQLVNTVNEMGIIYQGYATYRGISEAEHRIQDEPFYMRWKDLLKDIATSKEDSNNKVTESQILLRWLLDNGVAIIPRSSNKTHLQENWNLWNFELTDEENEMLMSRAMEGEFKEEL